MKKLGKLTLKELSGSVKVLNTYESGALLGGSDQTTNLSYNYYAPSYGIPEGGAAYSYNVYGGVSYDQNNNTIFVSAAATTNGTTYSGSVQLYIDGVLVTTQALTDSGNASYIPAGTTNVGNTTFDVNNYSNATDVKVVVTTSQSLDSGYGTSVNVIPNSHTIDIK